MNKGLVLTLLFAAALPLLAQDVPPPTAPLVAEPARGTSWRVTFHFDTTPGTKPVTAQRLPETAAFHCAKNATVVVLNWSDGTRTTGYIFGNSLLERNGDSGSISSLQAQDADPIFPVFTKGYPGVNWIALPNYKGPKPVSGGPAYYFASSTRGDRPGRSQHFSDQARGPLDQRARQGAGAHQTRRDHL